MRKEPLCHHLPCNCRHDGSRHRHWCRTTGRRMTPRHHTPADGHCSRSQHRHPSSILGYTRSPPCVVSDPASHRYCQWPVGCRSVLSSAGCSASCCSPHNSSQGPSCPCRHTGCSASCCSPHNSSQGPSCPCRHKKSSCRQWWSTHAPLPCCSPRVPRHTSHVAPD